MRPLDLLKAHVFTVSAIRMWAEIDLLLREDDDA